MNKQKNAQISNARASMKSKRIVVALSLILLLMLASTLSYLSLINNNQDSDYTARCVVDNKYHIINTNGKSKFSSNNYISLPSEGKYVVEIDGKFKYINSQFKNVSNNVYDLAFPYREGLAVVCKNRKYYYIDHNEEVRISGDYQFAFTFSEGKATVVVNDKCGVIDKSGKYIIQPEYDSLGTFKSGRAFAKRNGETLIIDEHENVYDSIDEGDIEDACIYERNGRYGIMNNGKYVTDAEYNEIGRKVNNIYPCRGNFGWQYIDNDGLLVSGRGKYYDSADEFCIVAGVISIDANYNIISELTRRYIKLHAMDAEEERFESLIGMADALSKVDYIGDSRLSESLQCLRHVLMSKSQVLDTVNNLKYHYANDQILINKEHHLYSIDINGGARRVLIEDCGIFTVSECGDYYAVALWSEPKIMIGSILSNDVLYTIRISQNAHNMELSRGAKYLAVNCAPYKIVLYDVETGAPCYTYKYGIEKQPIESIGINNSNRNMIVCADNGSVIRLVHDDGTDEDILRDYAYKILMFYDFKAIYFGRDKVNVASIEELNSQPLQERVLNAHLIEGCLVMICRYDETALDVIRYSVETGKITEKARIPRIGTEVYLSNDGKTVITCDGEVIVRPTVALARTYRIQELIK